MKWVLTADLQFDEQKRYAKTLPSGLSSRLMDSIQCWEWITQIALDEQCAGILALGDIFDSRTEIDVSVLDQVSRAFSATVSEGLELKILVGNHDCYLRAPQVNSTQIFVGTADVYDEPVVVPPFAFLPWYDHPDEFLVRLQKLAERPDAKYLLTHCLVEGAVPADKGYSIEALMPERWQVFLGDVHEPIALADGSIQYVGAPMQWHHGDAGGSRGVFVLDDETGEKWWYENDISPRFHVIESLEDDLLGSVSKVCEKDFVRVQCADYEDAEKAVALASSITSRVENLSVEPLSAEDEPRLQVSTSATHEEVLSEYVEFRAGDDSPDMDCDGLVDLGVEFVQLAQKL